MSFLSHALGAAVGFVTGGPAGAVAGGIAGIPSFGHTATPVARPGGAPVLYAGTPGIAVPGPDDSGGMPSPPPDQQQSLSCELRARALPTPHTKSGQKRAWRTTKKGTCTWHKRPAMNVANPHAARRAIHRIVGARRLLVSIERALPKRHHRAGSSRGGDRIEVVKA